MELQREQSSHPQRFLRFIPEEVLEQLRFHLVTFSASIAKMVDLLLESGMHVNELCTLPFDCLVEDKASSWFLRYPRLKTQQEQTFLLSYRAAAALREQQQAVGKEQGSAMHFLFPNAKGFPCSRRTFMERLNRIARERDIRDSSGEVWRFQAHQFRHTVMARMINDGMPLHLIQYYLNERTLDEVARVYKQVFGSSRREEFFPGRAEGTDRKGKCGERRELFDSVGAQWISQHGLSRNPPVGYCTLPSLASPCLHICRCQTEA